MLTELWLGLASLTSQNVGGPELEFVEQTFTLPAGIVELTTDHDWNAVTLFSKQNEPLPEIKYQNAYGDFIDWHAETDHGAQQNLLELLVIPERADSLVLKIEKDIEVVGHFFDSTVEHEREYALNLSSILGNPSSPMAPRFISRQDWSADETLRVRHGRDGGERKLWIKTELGQLTPDFRPRIVAKTDPDGKPLSWPVAENQKVAKFVIHHTGEIKHSDKRRNPKEILRSIYAYHTLTRGWGDIGYNYVIDKFGNVYEGRAGGVRSVGAHTAYHNVGTVGIALMGNFQRELPTEAQKQSLIMLLADHVLRFKVDPLAKSMFLDTHSYNITGHRHVARPGHGTSCPGYGLTRMLPEIRQKVADASEMLKRQRKGNGPKGRDFLQKSIVASGFTGQRSQDLLPPPTKQTPITFAELLKPMRLSRGDKKMIDIRFENNTTFDWPKGSVIGVSERPEGMKTSDFRSVEPIMAGRSGVFRGFFEPHRAPNGRYNVTLQPDFLDHHYSKKIAHNIAFDVPLQISGDRSHLFTKSRKATSKKVLRRLTGSTIDPSSVKTKTRPRVASRKLQASTIPSSPDPMVKVKLAFFDQRYADITSNQKSELWAGTGKLANVKPGEMLRFREVQGDGKTWVEVTVGDEIFKKPSFTVRTNGILKIKNYDRGISHTTPYNQFRRTLHIHPAEDHKLFIVNELPIEEYLRGLAEEPSTEPDEKRHAIHVLARSYALVYSGEKRKFGTFLYDLEDDPRTSQYYLGYDWERYHGEQKQLLKSTEGQVLLRDGKAVIGPYFTQSSGQSSGKWNRLYPWAKVQPLPHDQRLVQRGHGVGLSGNSARVLAEQGKDYQEIIDYFFEGVEVDIPR